RDKLRTPVYRHWINFQRKACRVVPARRVEVDVVVAMVSIRFPGDDLTHVHRFRPILTADNDLINTGDQHGNIAGKNRLTLFNRHNLPPYRRTSITSTGYINVDGFGREIDIHLFIRSTALKFTIDAANRERERYMQRLSFRQPCKKDSPRLPRKYRHGSGNVRNIQITC